MGEAAQAGGKGPQIDYQGVSYELSPWDVDMAEMLELWLEERAWQSVERHRHRITPEEYERRLGIVAKQIAAGDYSYLSPAFARASSSLPGQRYISFLMLMRKNRGMTVELAAEICDANLALVKAKMESMEALDPNSGSPAPEAPAAGEEASARSPGETPTPATATP